MNGQSLAARYDAASYWWADSLHRLGYGEAYQSLLRRILSRSKNRRVCDMGTGTGALAAAYQRVNGVSGELVLVDPSAPMLAQAAAAVTEASCIQADLAGFAPRSPFDLVMAAHVIEHCPAPAAAIAGLARLVRPGGQLILIVSKPHWCQWLIWLRWRHHWFAARDVCEMCQAAGLELHSVAAFHTGPPSRTSLGYLLQKPLSARGSTP